MNMDLLNKILVKLNMKLVIVIISILLTVNVPYSDGFGSGAPASTSICSSMTPGHHVAAQDSSIPYTIQLDKTTVNGGDLVTVTLMSSGNDAFKGFLVMARRKDYKNDKAPQGKMSELLKSGPTLAKVTSCSEVKSSSITHVNNDDKREVQFQWEAPNHEDGEYVIVATMVKSFDTYWVEHPSEVIRVKRNANVQAVATEKPINVRTRNLAFDKNLEVLSPAARAALDKIYDGCGESKGCFGIPGNCLSSKSCEIVVSFMEDGENGIKFELGGDVSGGGSAYLAVGLSKDQSMGDDSIFACQNSGEPAIVEYYSTGKTSPKTSNAAQILKSPSQVSVDGYLVCNFNVKAPDNIITIPSGTSYNLINDRVHILLARGTSSTPPPNAGLTYHEGVENRGVSGETIRLTETNILVGGKSQILIQLHGAFMIMAWLLCASTGMFTARYFKQTHVDTKPCGVVFWFALHRTLMALTVLMSLTASVMIFVEIKGYTEAPEGAIAEYYHPILGIVLSSLAILQVLIAFCRPLPNAKNRYIFNWIHWIIGNTAHILGIACIFLANDLKKTNLQSRTEYWGILTAFIVFHVCLHIIMSIHTLKADKQMEIQNKKRAVLPGPMKLSGLDAEAPGTGFRSAMLTIYMLAAAGTASALVYFVVSSLNEV